MNYLFNFAFIHNLENMLEDLYNIAQEEENKWEYFHNESRYSKPISRNYLNYTFRRLNEEGKVIELGHRACFNSGLVTENQEEIFIVFKPNNNPQQKWCFDSICKASDYKLTEFSTLPERASYFEDTTYLVYDLRLGEPRIDYNHIISSEENRSRFPEPYKSMSDYALQVPLEGAVRLAIKRVKRNYKSAVPQYFWDRNARTGKLQLLLPLCMGAPSKADVALVIDRTNNVYSGETILTLDMAYNNARLLAIAIGNHS